MQINTYVNYGGNCEQAFKFYEQHLGGRVVMLMRHGEGPAERSAPGLTGVLHARLELGQTHILGADVPADRFQPMRSAYLTITADSNEEADRIYSLLTDGGEIFMKMAETFFASRFAMFRDRFGTSWMLLGPSKMR